MHRHLRASQNLLLVLDEWDRECHPAWRKVCCWDLYCKILMLQMHPLTHSISLEEGLCHCCWEVLMDACVSWYWSLDSHTANYLLLVCIRVAREDWTLNRGVSADSHEHPRDFGVVGWVGLGGWYYYCSLRVFYVGWGSWNLKFSSLSRKIARFPGSSF